MDKGIAPNDWRRRGVRTADIDPAELVEILKAAGWRATDQRTWPYVRLLWPDEYDLRGRSTLIPLDREAGDYADSMRPVLLELIHAADLGRSANTVLSALAAGLPPVPAVPDPLDQAMHDVWLYGKWQWITRNMSREAKEAAVAAVLRYSRCLERDEPEEKPMTRERLAWWD